MKSLVCIKQVLALDDDIVLTDDARDVDPRVLDASLNEWDTFALEAALRLRDVHGGEVVAATCGAADAEPVLRRALAMGVDRGVRVEDAGGDPFTVGAALAHLARELEPDLVLCGAQSSDSAQGATGAVIAGLLDVPCVAVARSVEPAGDCAVDVERELEGGVVDRLRVSLPAVVTVQTGANQPRYANLRAIKLAEREPIEVVRPGQSGGPAYEVRAMVVPPAAGRAQSLGDDVHEAAATIVRLLRERVR
jgi:electron transfer flavoprotein beta subunit